MSLEAIRSIKEAESQTEQIIKNAEQEAKVIIEKAQAESKIKTAESLEKFGLEMDEITKTAESKAQTQATQIMLDMENQCKGLKTSADKNMSKAIEFVIKEIKGK